MIQRPLFVFGTLRRGESNHYYLAESYARVLPAELPGHAIVEFLMIAPRRNGTVSGELFFIRPDVYEKTLAQCDDLESIPVGHLAGPLYQRVLVTVETAEGPYEAWAYTQAD